ncbi:MAG: hypothetical protein SFY67_09845 [Candidatus Melainabacteria bacterium]|nr:hypothetical protein [Candidatus Melainabacteria bacterium]
MTFRFIKTGILTALIALFTFGAGGSQAAEKTSEALKAAIATYGQGQYASALDKLNALSGTDQSSELARYYKGLCYQQTNQTEAAQREYYWLYSKGHDPSLKYKAWQGLKSVGSIKAQNKALKNRPAESSKAIKTAKAERGPGSDAWVTPGEDYGYSGPPPTTSFTFERRQKACGRR